jgi:2',3'-cyclic-nucleotide 2'-phosphodiesterase (5'-nucleotidase family)
MSVEKRFRTLNVGLVVAAALVAALTFAGCSTEPEEEPSLNWEKAIAWDGADTTTVLGSAPAAISATGIRYKETPLGNLIADGIVEYARYTSGEKVVFALLNGQNVQNLVDIPAGDITTENLSSGNALTDTLYIVTYTGAEVETIINTFVNSDAYESTGSGWRRNCVVLVSSGVSYTVTPNTDSTQPPHATDIKVNGAAIKPADTYRVAVGSFMATNTNFPAGQEEEKDSYSSVTLKQAVARYILAKGTIRPATEGRINGTVPVKLPAE